MTYTEYQTKKEKKQKADLKAQNQNVQKILNARLDSQRLKVLTGTEYDAGVGTHKDDTIYFVKRSATNWELYKGETKISGQGGSGINITNCLITLSSYGFVSGEVTSDTSLNSASYPNATGSFHIKTTGVYSGGSWSKTNAPSSSGVCLNHNQYAGWSTAPIQAYPMLVIDIVRSLSGTYETLYFYDCQTYVSQTRAYDASSTYQNRTIGNFSGTSYDWPIPSDSSARGLAYYDSAIYIERYSGGTLLSSGWYYPDSSGSHMSPYNNITLRFNSIHIDQNYGPVANNFDLYFNNNVCFEIGSDMGLCRQLGLRYDFGATTTLETPWLRFDTANVSTHDNNEYTQALLIAGQCL